MKRIHTFEGFLNEASSSNKGFWRLPDKVIGNELYRAKKGLDSLYSTIAAGNDLDMGALENIIDFLQKIKEQAKKFKSAEEIKGTVYEGNEINEGRVEMNRLKERGVHGISIWGKPDELFAKEFGKDIEIPKYPQQGEVNWKGKKIGYVNNFNGFVITDIEWIVDNLDRINKIVAKTGFWYN